jgi:hypothetical protein
MPTCNLACCVGPDAFVDCFCESREILASIGLDATIRCAKNKATTTVNPKIATQRMTNVLLSQNRSASQLHYSTTGGKAQMGCPKTF